MAVVEFSLDEFRTQYPRFSDEEHFPDESLRLCFDMAVELIGNTDETSLAPYDPPKVQTRKILLYLAACHFATLDADNPGGNVGRLASASQGSVSTSFDLIKSNSTAGDWWLQTQCGARFWMLTARYRLGGRFYGNQHYHPWG